MPKLKTTRDSVKQYFSPDSTPICTECGGPAVRNGTHLCQPCDDAGIWRTRSRWADEQLVESKQDTDSDGQLSIWDQ